MPSFNEEARHRISLAVRRGERAPRSQPAPGSPPQILRHSMFGLVSSAQITAFDTTTNKWGRGKVMLYVLKADASDDVTETSLNEEVIVYHRGSSTIAGGKPVQLKVICDKFVVDVDYC